MQRIVIQYWKCGSKNVFMILWELKRKNEILIFQFLEIGSENIPWHMVITVRFANKQYKFQDDTIAQLLFTEC